MADNLFSDIGADTPDDGFPVEQAIALRERATGMKTIYNAARDGGDADAVARSRAKLQRDVNDIQRGLGMGAPAPAKSSSNPFADIGGAPAEKTVGDHAKDLGLSLAKGVIAVPEAAVGLADIATGGRAGKLLENEDGLIGFRPKQAKEMLSELHSEGYKHQQADFEAADGVLAKAEVALENPSLIGNVLVESAPSMGAGGVAGRGIAAGAKALGMGVPAASVIGGAAGEGAVMAGTQAEQIRQETDDGLLTGKQAGLAAATGLAGATFGWLGGKAAAKLGFGDIDTLLASEKVSRDQLAEMIAQMPPKSVPRHVIESAASEGLLEELPQSVTEQVLQNIALDKPWHEGVDGAIVMGTLAGGAMGAGTGVYTGATDKTRRTELMAEAGRLEGVAEQAAVRAEEVKAQADTAAVDMKKKAAAGARLDEVQALEAEQQQLQAEIEQQRAAADAAREESALLGQEALATDPTEPAASSAPVDALAVDEPVTEQAVDTAPAATASEPQAPADFDLLLEAYEEQAAAAEAEGDSDMAALYRERQAQLREQQAALPQAVEAPAAVDSEPAASAVGEPIAAGDGANGWQVFDPAEGGLNVPRAEMPQVAAEHRGALVGFLKGKGVGFDKAEVPATALKPTQAEYHPEKVAKAAAREGGNRSILVSSDNHVIDGHHQWLAARDAGESVPVIRLDKPAAELLPLVHEFPSSTVDASSAIQDDATQSVAAPAVDPTAFLREQLRSELIAEGMDPARAAEVAEQEQAATDELLGDTYAPHHLTGVIERAQAQPEPQRYFHVEMENLGGLNGVMGSAVAVDGELANLAAALREAVPDGVLVSRGGSNFSLVVPATSEQQAAARLATLSEQINARGRELAQAAGLDDIPGKGGGNGGLRLAFASGEINERSPEQIITETKKLATPDTDGGASHVTAREITETWARSSPGGHARVHSGTFAYRASRSQKARGKERGLGGEAQYTGVSVTRSVESGDGRGVPAFDRGDGRVLVEASTYRSPAAIRRADLEERAQALGLTAAETDRLAARRPEARTDPTTGLWAKTELSLLHREAQRFVADEGLPVFYVSLDIANLSGMNLGLAPDVATSRKLADQLFKSMTDIAADALAAVSPEVQGVRQGGDEISFFVPGADLAAVEAAVAEAKQAVADFLEETGYARLPHLKTFTPEVLAGSAERDLSRDGTGLYAGISEVFPDTPLTEMLGEADEEVAADKYLPRATPRTTYDPLAWKRLDTVDADGKPLVLDDEGAATAPILQNRDRSNVGLVQQMQSIASNPDFTRLSFSRDFGSGAPVIVDPGTLAPAQLGRKDKAATGGGRTLTVQYAVIEAGEVIASHDAMGNANPEYDNDLRKPLAIAGNGRAAGLQSAYKRGSAAKYRADMQAELADMYGIEPAVIADMQAPILVRLMQAGDVTATIGDESNAQTTARMSPRDQALTDVARGYDFSAIEYTAGGRPTRDALAAWVRSLPIAEQAGLMTDAGPNADAADRLDNAIFTAAYDSAVLQTLAFEALDPESKTLISALQEASPKIIQLREYPAYDVSLLIAEAAEGIITARRSNLSIDEFLDQQDIGRTPEALPLMRLMADNLRSGKRIAGHLIDLADALIFDASQNDADNDMFGGAPKRGREAIYNETVGADNGQENAGVLAQPSGPAGADGGLEPGPPERTEQPGAAPSGEGEQADGSETDQAGDTDDNFLTSYNEQELAARAQAQADAVAASAANERAQAAKDQADSELNDFRLTGSNSAADVAAAGGQQDLLGGGFTTRGERSAAGTSERVAADRQEPADQPALASDIDAAGQRDDDAGGGSTGRAADAGQQGDSGVSTDSDPVGGERGDFSLPVGDSATELASVLAGADFTERGADIGDAGVSTDPAAVGAVGAAVAPRVTSDQLGVPAEIQAALPQLLPGQQLDVARTEARFAKPDGFGMLLANGTGTGKTYSGLGVIKRFADRGKTNVLIMVPDDKIAQDWIVSGRDLGLEISMLANTQDAGRGIVVTTYANAGDNNALAGREFDLVVPDEAQKLMQNEQSKDTKALRTLRVLTMHPDSGHLRHSMENAEAIAEMKRLAAAETAARQEGDAAAAADYQAQHQALSGELVKRLDEARARVAAVTADERPRALFLSATPFAYEGNIDWANGYLFDYGEPESRGGYNQPNGQQAFMIQHFGYKMRYGRLEQPDAKVDRGLMQRNFNSYLRRSGAMSVRMLEVDADYDRKFVLVSSGIGERIDQALDYLREQRSDNKPLQDLSKAVNDQFDYLARRRLLEAIKANAVIGDIRAQLALGRKVVVFHDYKEGGGINPFLTAYAQVSGTGDPAVTAFAREFSDLLNADFGSYPSAINTFRRAFTDGRLLVVNGDETKKDNLQSYKTFQSDDSGPMVILVQSAKNAGWSGHDTTGKYPRVLYNLGLPTAPTVAIQQEGRIYRTGQVSNAQFRYLNTGTNWEMVAFASTIASRASTAENLAMGEDARALKQAFIDAFNESDRYPPGHAGEGVGGKARDREANNILTEMDRARAFYYGQQKKNSKTKAAEGVDYFATPEPVGYVMARWLGLEGGEDALEPSGGHGAIARWLPENTNRTVVEPSGTLMARLSLVMLPAEDRLINDRFENLNIVNKFDGIAMNPPFGVGGADAVAHLAKAVNHLRAGGRVAAIIPSGPSADKRFEKWLYAQDDKGRSVLGDVHFAAEILLPAVTFERAGTKVVTRIVVLDKLPADVTPNRSTQRIDLRGIEQIDELFDRLDALDIAPRLRDPARAPALPVDAAPVPAEAVGQPPSGQQAPSAVAPATSADADAEPTITREPGEVWVEYVTKRGKTLRGLVRSISQAEAKAIDAYTFKMNGGYFIREKHVVEAQAAPAVAAPTDALAAFAAEYFGERVAANGRLARDNFVDRFRDSKVLDDEGRPLVMYHGTNYSDQGDAFTYFDVYASNYGLMGQGGYFTANPEVASEYTAKGRGDTPTVYPVFLDIRNPLDMDAPADAEAWALAFPGAKAYHDGGETNESWYRAAEEMLTDEQLPIAEGAEQMQAGLRAMGFDGITHIGGGRVTANSVAHRVYIAFEQEQIKSATGNNGNFDSGHDLRYSRRDAPSNGLARAVAEQVIEQFQRDYRGSEQLRIKLHEAGPAPLDGADRMALGQPQGAYINGAVHLFLDAHDTPAELLATLRHEVWAHAGIDLLPDAERLALLKAVSSARRQSQILERAWQDHVLKNYRHDPAEVQVEELLAWAAAEYGELIDKRAKASPLYKAIRKLMTVVRDALHAVGLLGPRDGVDAVIDLLLANAERLRGSELLLDDAPGTDRSDWEQARAAGRTKLDYDAWVQVRTPAFKAWFGEWQHDGQATRDTALQEGPDSARVAGSDAATDAGGERAVRSAWRFDRDTGEPRIFYHGTRDRFTVFDLDSANRKDAGWLGTGVYLTDSSALANTYAQVKSGDGEPQAMALFTNVRNPFIATVDDKKRGRRFNSRAYADTFTAVARANGHDGVLLEHVDGTVELVAFDVAGVKSATDNNGDFDPANPDIRYSRRPQPQAQPLARRARKPRVLNAQGLLTTLMPSISRLRGHGFAVDVVATFDELPAEARVRNDLAIVRAGKTIYVVRDRLASSKQARAVLNRVAREQEYGSVSAVRVLADFAERASAVPPVEAAAKTVAQLQEAAKSGRLAFLTLDNLADVARSRLPAVHHFSRLVRQLDADRNELIGGAGVLAERWRKWANSNKKQADDLANLMHDTTLAGVDPSQEYAPLITREQLLEKLAVFDERIRGVSGEGARVAALMKQKEDLVHLFKQEKNREKVAPELIKRWLALPDEARAIYQEARDFYKQQRADYLLALEARIEQDVKDRAKAKLLMDKLRYEFESNAVQEPYFPLQRFGDYWVAEKDGAGNVERVLRFETEGEWKTYRDAVKKAGIDISAGKQIDGNFKDKSVPPEFLTAIDGLLQEQLGALSDELRDEVYQLYLHSLPKLSGRKHFIHRQGTEGYSHDAIRAFAHNTFHFGYQLARLRWLPKLQATIRTSEEALKAAASDEAMALLNADVIAGKAEVDVLFNARRAQPDLPLATDFHNEMLKRLQWVADPKGAAWANKLTSLGFVWYLGASPAAAVVNILQTPMVTFPAMGARWGFAKSSKALLKAQADFFKGGASFKNGFFSIEKVLAGDELDAFNELARRGVIDKSMVHDLAGLAEAGSEYGDTWYRVMNTASWMFHKAEVLNRQVSSLAAYRLALAAGNSHEKAIDAAEDVVQETHFNYGSSNRPRFMQSNVAKVALLFKQYAVNMTFFWYRGAQQALAGDREAQKKMAMVTVMHLAFAGATGMIPEPIWPMLMWAVSTLGAAGDDDEPFDAEVELRVFLAEVFGAKGGQAIAKGLGNAAGVDIHGRVGINSMWYREPNKEMGGRDLFNHLITQVAGPVAGIAANQLYGLQLLGEGQTVRGVEYMLPTFARNLVRAGRYSQEGATTLRGDTLTDLNAAQIVAQAVGFTPAEMADRYEENNAKYNYMDHVAARRKQLMNRYYMATKSGDRQLAAEVKAQITAFNRKHGDQKITDKTLKRSAKSRESYSKHMENGVRVTPKQRGTVERLEFAPQ